MAVAQPLFPVGGSEKSAIQPRDDIRPNWAESKSFVSPQTEVKEERDKQIQKLARSLSQTSQVEKASDSSDGGINTFLDLTSDPELDPNSDRFKSRKWVRNMLQMTSRDPDRYPRRTAGVSFRNLNVYGYGTAADYQMNVANFWLKAVGAIRGIFNSHRKVRIDILRDFEGIVHSGEMLVVLGRPGRYGSLYTEISQR
jgi:ATP-binding cassette subfamily G (WHITE) protein 2 (PDR)